MSPPLESLGKPWGGQTPPPSSVGGLSLVPPPGSELRMTQGDGEMEALSRVGCSPLPSAERRSTKTKRNETTRRDVAARTNESRATWVGRPRQAVRVKPTTSIRDPTWHWESWLWGSHRVSWSFWRARFRQLTEPGFVNYVQTPVTKPDQPYCQLFALALFVRRVLSECT